MRSNTLRGQGVDDPQECDEHRENEQREDEHQELVDLVADLEPLNSL